MERTLIGELKSKVGEAVLIKGWVSVRRDQGKMVFFDLRDRSGSVQGVVLPTSTAIEIAKDVRNEYVVAVEGNVNERPEKNRNVKVQNGDIELEIEKIEITSKAEIPFELGSEVNLDTHLDHLPFTLRSQRSRDIFSMQAALLDAYRNSLRSQGFVEFVAPAFTGQDAEGGGAAFEVNYFHDKKAYLTVSPQFYKQIMAGAFERVFTVAKIFRAEKSATTRHLSEATCLDFEMGFINDEREPMAVLEQTIKDTVQAVSAHKEIFERMGTTVPQVPEHIPVFTLAEAHELIAKEYNRTIEDILDMAPEDERQICEYAKNNLGSDFVFITRFPTKKRAFYTYEDPSEAPFSRGFDLLFRGLEINSGAQRIHNYEALLARIQEREFDPAKFAYYLQAFKVGMPPHGGSSTGLERLTARMLEIHNVKEATAFPRDMNRIDTLLSNND